MRWPAPVSAFRQVELSISEKLQQISLGLILLIVAIGCVGFVMLYSANQSLEPWALRQMVRFGSPVTVDQSATGRVWPCGSSTAPTSGCCSQYIRVPSMPSTKNAVAKASASAAVSAMALALATW